MANTALNCSVDSTAFRAQLQLVTQDTILHSRAETLNVSAKQTSETVVLKQVERFNITVIAYID